MFSPGVHGFLAPPVGVDESADRLKVHRIAADRVPANVIEHLLPPMAAHKETPRDSVSHPVQPPRSLGHELAVRLLSACRLAGVNPAVSIDSFARSERCPQPCPVEREYVVPELQMMPLMLPAVGQGATAVRHAPP